MEPAQMDVFSFGGGVQGSAIFAAILRGMLPRPDLSVIADTSREGTPTWDWIRGVIMPALDAEGMTLHIAPHSLATVDLYSGSGKLEIPAFTSRDGLGQLSGYCSNEWKLRVVQRFVRQQRPEPMDVRCWIGFSTDEVHRARMSRDREGWWNNWYPLIEHKPARMTRADCHALIRAMGWNDAPEFAETPSSSCWMCPFRSDEEWRSMPRADFKAAIELQHEVRKTDPHIWLHRSMRLLEDIDFDAQSGLFDERDRECNSGHCFT